MIDYIYAKRRHNSTYKWCKQRMLSQTNLANCMNIVTQLLAMMDSNHLITKASTQLISRETVQERRHREAVPRDALKRRKVEILDISHNDRVQREADYSSSIDHTPAVEGGTMEDVDSDDNGEGDLADLTSSSNKKMDVREFAGILEGACGKSLTSIISKEIEMFFGFLLSSIYYPNYAISNKA